jgi:anti-anti-sigma factor
MTLETQIRDNAARIIMKGRFDFQIHKEFKESYIKLFDNPDVRQIEIEMSQLEYLDSSALGMLMLLNERAKSVNKTISLVNPSGVVDQVLEVANFNRLFNITKNS